MDITLLLSILIILVLILIILQFTGDRNGRLEKGLNQTFRQEIREFENSFRKEIATNRKEWSEQGRIHQETLGHRLSDLNEHNSRHLATFQKQLSELNNDIRKRLHEFDQNTFRSLKEIRHAIDQRLEQIRKDNNEKLEKMRVTVDEKLHKTLEERLGHSFKLVSDSLEKVQKGLGEMQNLASGVGDLKKVLSNVKTRGMLGELQLGNILEQILSPEQYAINVATIPNSRNHVEFAIKFPGKEIDGHPVWLPIDSKFPMQPYSDLNRAYDQGTPQEIEIAKKELMKTVRIMARDIHQKYISPPHTTDFGVLFLPTEGLYAEIVRHPDLIETLQVDYRILIAGPTNLAAFLNSLQMGFRSIAIEKRSSEVWKILGAVKTEFGKFGEILSKTQKKLEEATNVIDKAGVRTRAIERKLRDVEELPAGDNSIFKE